ncbi:hypothetical protein CEP54_002046 [Fusarium duplospermum]|uniref:Uncharacterized protein n=1 Tax=Fusarium duplospermum TaxID=1325734 RepID=A0A428QXS7_9HYPO|nr:hypothetical protein CEP54_002046 [Fusarium duplospermum]
MALNGIRRARLGYRGTVPFSFLEPRELPPLNSLKRRGLPLLSRTCLKLPYLGVVRRDVETLLDEKKKQPSSCHRFPQLKKFIDVSFTESNYNTSTRVKEKRDRNTNSNI